MIGTLLAMLPATSEWTTQIPTTCVTGMREKPNPAMNAVRHTGLELGMGPQDRIERKLILRDERLGAIVLMPIWPTREKLLDGYDKKARLSVMI